MSLTSFLSVYIFYKIVYYLMTVYGSVLMRYGVNQQTVAQITIKLAPELSVC